MAISNYLESGLLNHLFRTGSFPKPPTLAICLCTGIPQDSNTGVLTNIEVANVGAYARQVLPPLDANWAFVTQAEGGSGKTSNLSAVTFPQATANWGTIKYVAITDSGAYGSGNLLFFNPLVSEQTINTNNTFSYAIGDLAAFMD